MRVIGASKAHVRYGESQGQAFIYKAGHSIFSLESNRPTPPQPPWGSYLQRSYFCEATAAVLRRQHLRMGWAECGNRRGVRREGQEVGEACAAYVSMLNPECIACRLMLPPGHQLFLVAI